MPIQDENADPIYQKMVAAWEGDPETWGRIHRGLRDAIVDYAARRCPHYRKVVPPTGGFSDVPILTGSLVRERGEDLLAEGVPVERRVPTAAAGATGAPLRFFRDTSQGPAEDISARRFLERLHGITDATSTVWVGDQPPAGADGLARRRGPWRRRGPSVHALPGRGLTPSRIAREVAAWGRLAPYALLGRAAAIHRIAEHVETASVPITVPPASIVTTGDPPSPDVAARIAGALRAPVHSRYGPAEVGGVVAGTLPETRRYVFNPLLVYVEVLDGEGRPARPGRTGRLVLTDLNNYVMPFIRYETGTAAVASDRTSGGWPAVEGLSGRGPVGRP